MYRRTSVLPVLWGWATDPNCREQLCGVPGGVWQSSHGFACVPPPPGCTMNCDSTRHIQKSRHPTPDHARIGTAFSSNTEWGYTNLHTTGLHSRVYVLSLKADHGEP